jgi:hypothetical protein
MGRIDELIAQGNKLANLDTGEPLAEVRDQSERERLLWRAADRRSAGEGAQIVVTGRCTDTSHPGTDYA